MKKTARILVGLSLILLMLFSAVSAYAATGAKDAQGRYNVTQFGAKANDSTSDRDAIQQALDLAKSGSGTTKVYIPSGTYILDRYLTIYSNTELIMESDTVLKGKDGILGFIRRDFSDNTNADYSSISNVTISGGVFDGSDIQVGNDTEFIYLDHGQNITLKNSIFRDNCGRHAVTLDGVRNVTCSNLTFINCTRYSNYSEEDSRRTSEALHIDHISTDGVSAAGARPYNDGVTSNNIVVENCRFENCNAGVGCHWARNIARGSGFTVRNCTFTNVRYTPINVAAYNNINISGNTADDAVCFMVVRQCAGVIENNTIGRTHGMSDGSQGYGILAYGCDNTSSNILFIRNNTLKNCANTAITTATDNTVCRYITIENNTIPDCQRYGILCRDGGNITIRGNTVTNAANTGISCSGVENLLVSRNTVTGCNLDIWCQNCTGQAEGNTISNSIGQSSDTFAIIEGSGYEDEGTDNGGNSSGGSGTGSWQKSGSRWWYRNADGSYPKAAWAKIGGVWYHFDNSGYMQTGWQKIGNTWYYFSASGAMQTGWQKINNVWYYLGSDGAMQTGWLKSGGKWYYLDGGGAMRTGWLKTGGKWYYLDGSGAMRTGWLKTGGEWYYLDGSGAMRTGWLKAGGKWYYLDDSGAMQTGWLKSGGTWYYLKSDGSMAASETVDGYAFDASGAWIE